MNSQPSLPADAADLRRRTEDGLRSSEHFIRGVLDSLTAHIAVLDAQGVIVAVNEAWRRFAQENAGMDSDAYLGANYLTVCEESLRRGPDEGAAAALQGLRDVLSGQRDRFSLEYPCHSPNEQRWFTLQATRFAGEGAVQVVVAHENITQRKQVEEALRQSERKYRKLHESMRDAFVSVDMAGKVQECNRAYREMLGYEDEELRRLTYIDLTPEKWHASETRIVAEQILPRGYSDVYEKEYRRQDGTVFPVELRTFLIRDEQERPAAMWAIVRDITQRRQTELALQESEHHYRAVVEDQTELISRCREDGTFTFVNEVYCRFFGKTSEQLLGRHWQPQAVAEDLPLIQEKLRTLSPANSVVVIENRVHSGTGEVRWMQFVNRGFFDPDGRHLETQAVGRDITERKQMEQRLDRLAERMAVAARSAQLGVWDWDIQRNEVIWDERMHELYGVKREDFGASYEAWLNAIHPEDRARCAESTQEALRRGEDYDSDFRVVWPDGSIHYLRACGHYILAGDGTPLRMVGINYDITQRRQAEQALRESERLFSTIFRASAAAIGISRLDDGVFLDVNEAFLRLHGYTREQVVGHTSEELGLWHSPNRTTVFRQLRESPGIQMVEMQGRHKSGEVCDLLASIALVELAGQPCVVGILIDITKRKRAEQALQESERLFSALFRSSADAMAISRVDDGIFLNVNEAFVRLYGYTREEVVGHSSEELGLWHSTNRTSVFQQLRERPWGQTLEFQGRRKNGEICDLLASMALIELAGQPCAVGILIDITERKRIEEALHFLSARFLQVQDQERRRLARELHDTTAQTLAALVIHLNLLYDLSEPRSARTKKLLGESLDLAEKCANEIRTQCFLLHPPVLDELGLAGAIRDHADGFGRRSGLRVDLSLPRDLGRLPRETELALFRVLQEALSNIHRHSGSKTASITLTQTAEEIRLEVRDQGRGMGSPVGGASVAESRTSDDLLAPARQEPRPTAWSGGASVLASQGSGDKNVAPPDSPASHLGVGISGMKERMRQLGGRLEIQSSASGTSVTAIVPRPQGTSHEPAPK